MRIRRERAGMRENDEDNKRVSSEEEIEQREERIMRIIRE